LSPQLEREYAARLSTILRELGRAKERRLGLKKAVEGELSGMGRPKEPKINDAMRIQPVVAPYGSIETLSDSP
jgi:hypothetical protein